MMKPRILICTCCNSDDRYNKFSDIISTHEKYAAKFDGIDSLFEIRWTDINHKPHWEKLKMLLDHIHDGYDYLMWMDDDAGFTKYDVDFRDYLPNDNKLAYFTREAEWFEGTNKLGISIKQCYLNTGVFLLKCTDEMANHLKALYDKRFTHTGPLNDQPEIISWYFDHKNECDLLEPKIFNAIPHKYKFVVTNNYPNENSIIIHFMGPLKSDNNLRLKYFRHD